MNELSEKELLLLSNYLYIDESVKYETINDMLDSCRSSTGWISPDKVSQLGIGGCMSELECRKLLCEMDHASEEFKSLHISRIIDEGGIRAACFTSGGFEDRDATVIFRGTGGSYEAWADNVRGEYMSDTVMQKLADDFIRYDCGCYDNITVAGHSKGGNLAQYVTVTNRVRVGRCISYDGHGFGNGFVKKYPSQIKDVSGRIKSVSAHNDYVNILLNCIAGEIMFVKNIGSSAVECHSSYSLYRSCSFDENGNIMGQVWQNPLMKGAGFVADKLSEMIDRLPKDGKVPVSELLAAEIAALFSNELSEAEEKGRTKEAVRKVLDYAASLGGLDGPDSVSVVTDSVYLDHQGLTQAVSDMKEMHRKLVGVIGRISDIRHSACYKAATKLAVNVILKKQESRLGDIGEVLADHTEGLKEIARLYLVCEKEITECMG